MTALDTGTEDLRRRTAATVPAGHPTPSSTASD